MGERIHRTSERTLAVGDREWPALFEFRDDPVTGLPFTVRRAKVTYEGGVVSVVWGSLTYSTNHDHGMDPVEFVEEPEVVEVGMWNTGGELHVLGYVDADGLNRMLDWIARGGSVDVLVEVWAADGGMVG